MPDMGGMPGAGGMPGGGAGPGGGSGSGPTIEASATRSSPSCTSPLAELACPTWEECLEPGGCLVEVPPLEEDQAPDLPSRRSTKLETTIVLGNLAFVGI